MTGCDPTNEWIWECEHPDDDPPDAIAEHLDDCAACQDEHRARRKVARELRALRFALDEAPTQATDRAVAAAVGAALADEASAFAPPASITSEVHHHHHPPGALNAPRATPIFLLTAAALLLCAVGVGFVTGRSTAVLPMSAADTHTTLATLPDLGEDIHKMHSVGLRQAGLNGLMKGSTFLLTGPRGGPYRVVAKVTVDPVAEELVHSAGSEEIVVAVASEGDWTRGSKLALSDLSDPSVSILARRSLSLR